MESFSYQPVNKNLNDALGLDGRRQLVSEVQTGYGDQGLDSSNPLFTLSGGVVRLPKRLLIEEIDGTQHEITIIEPNAGNDDQI
ncbi:MAG: hypothetical protein V4702_02860 [Patescibacteria group bacterium]